MTTADMWKILKRDYGIQTMEELETALKDCKGLDIGVFTKGERDDSERIPGEAECRVTA